MWRMLCVTERSLILSFNVQRSINKVYSRYDLSCGVAKIDVPGIFAVDDAGRRPRLFMPLVDTFKDYRQTT